MNRLRAAVEAAVAVGKRPNDGTVVADAVDVAGVNENVGAVVGFVTGNPNEAVGAVLAAGNNDEPVVPPENERKKSCFKLHVLFE